jgi:O-antigen/teichoic acid export membrane protein
MSAPVVDTPRRGFRAPGTGFMVVGSLLGALGAYLFQWYGTQVLEPGDFAPVSALWTLFFILATVLLVPVEQYVTREVARGRKSLPRDIRPGLVAVAVCAVIGLGFVAATLDQVFAGDPQYLLQIVLLCVGYGALFVGKGVLAGARRFEGVGWILIVETVVRLVAGVVLLRLVLDASSMGWAMVLGAFSVLGLAWWRHDTGSVDVEVSPPGRFLIGYVGGSAPAQVLLAAAPLAVWALGGSAELMSITFITFTLYRAPLTLIFAMQGRLLPYLVGLSNDRDHLRLGGIVRRVVLWGGALAIVGGLVGWVAGPEVVALLYGEAYAPSRLVASLVAGGVTAGATAQITSQVLVAEGRTRLLGLAWSGGLLTAAVVAIVLSGAPDTRVAFGFVSGELMALGLMGVMASRR